MLRKNVFGQYEEIMGPSNHGSIRRAEILEIIRKSIKGHVYDPTIRFKIIKSQRKEKKVKLTFMRKFFCCKKSAKL